MDGFQSRFGDPHPLGRVQVSVLAAQGIQTLLFRRSAASDVVARDTTTAGTRTEDARTTPVAFSRYREGV